MMRNCFGVKLIDFITILLYWDNCWRNNCLQCHIAVKDTHIKVKIKTALRNVVLSTFVKLLNII